MCATVGGGESPTSLNSEILWLVMLSLVQQRLQPRFKSFPSEKRRGVSQCALCILEQRFVGLREPFSTPARQQAMCPIRVPQVRTRSP
jgi:hypothetical protein